MEIIRLLQNIDENLEHKDIFSEDYINLKDRSIKKLKIGEPLVSFDQRGRYEEDNKWFVMANSLIENKVCLPLEAYLLIAIELRYEYLSDIKRKFTVKKRIYTYIEDFIFNDIQYNIDGNTLNHIINSLEKEYIHENKLKMIKLKFENLSKVYIDKDNCEFTGGIIGFLFEKASKMELTTYYNNLDNYYFIPRDNAVILDLKSLKVLRSINKDKLLDFKGTAYDYLNNYIIKDGEFNIYNKYLRILSYIIVDEIAVGKLTAVNEKIVRSFSKFDKLYNKDDMKKVYSFIKNTDLDRLLREFKDKPSKSTFNKILGKINSSDDLYSFVKTVPKFMEEPLDIDSYINVVKICASRQEFNLKIAMLCEEIIRKNPIILDDILKFLKKMYENNIFTRNSKQILEYIKLTGEDIRVDYMLLSLKSDEGNFDLEFMDNFLKLYNLSTDKTDFDNMINKIVNKCSYIAKKELVDIIYDFYLRNDDVNSLKILVKNINYKGLERIKEVFKKEDILKLFEFYNRKITVEEYIEGLELFENYKDDLEILPFGISILEKLYDKANKETLENINKRFFHIIKELSNKSSIILSHYISIILENLVLGKEISNEEIELLDKATLKNDILNDSSKRLKILKALMYYYSEKDYTVFKTLVSRYVKDFSEEDNNKTFIEFSKLNKEILKYLVEIIFNENFEEENTKGLLDILQHRILEGNFMDLLEDLINYYINLGFYKEKLDLVIDYINKKEIISNDKYNDIIFKIFDNLDEEDKVTLYKELIKRDDLPLLFREEYFDLDSSVENQDYLIEGFLSKKTETSFAKELSATKYYEDDDTFLYLISLGNSNKHTVNLVYEKIKENFLENKEYCLKLAKAEKAQDIRILYIKECIELYFDSKFSAEDRQILGEYRVKTIKDGKFCKRGKLSNIFNSQDMVDAIVFKNYDIGNIFLRYFYDMEIDFREIDRNCYVLNEENDALKFLEGDLRDLLLEFRKFINFIDSLLNLNVTLEGYEENYLTINEGIILPRNFQNIKDIENKEEENLRVTKKIKTLIKSFIERRSVSKDEEDSVQRVKNITNKEIFENNDVNTLEKLSQSLNNVVEDLSKELKEINLRRMLLNFHDLPKEKQAEVIEEVIESKNTMVLAKARLLSWTDGVYNKQGYLNYMLQCFNHSRSALVRGDFRVMYKEILDLLRERYMLHLYVDKYAVEDMFINASWLTGMNKGEILDDIEKLDFFDEKDLERVKDSIEKYSN
ncbi:MAG: hypothetical protein Q4B63_05525 [Clostridium perfringens]|nr:hypothetical protein [Clostridium perfringens]